MRYAAIGMDRDAGGERGTSDRATFVAQLRALAQEVETAGDGEMAGMFRGYARELERGHDAACQFSFKRQDGTVFRLADARNHIRRGGRPASGARPAAPSGGSPLKRQIEALSADCRKLASEVDQARIAAVLETADRRRRVPAASFEYDAEDDYDDSFGD